MLEMWIPGSVEVTTVVPDILTKIVEYLTIAELCTTYYVSHVFRENVEKETRKGVALSEILYEECWPCVEWLQYWCGCRFPYDSCNITSKNYRFGLTKWFFHQGYRVNEDVLVHALAYNNFDVIEWVLGVLAMNGNNKPWVMLTAANDRNLPVMKLLHRYDYPTSFEVYEVARTRFDYEMCGWLTEVHCKGTLRNPQKEVTKQAKDFVKRNQFHELQVMLYLGMNWDRNSVYNKSVKYGREEIRTWLAWLG
jgi:hypothetical protein